MRTLRSTPLVVLALFLLLGAACDAGEDEFSLTGDGVSIDDLTGSWRATRALFGVAAEGPVRGVDVVAEGGAVSLEIRDDGRFTLTITRPGGAPDRSTGRLGFDEDLLVVSFDDDPDEFEFFALQVTPTTLSIQGPATFDFDGDGTEEAADAVLDFVRS
ncbi:MAG: hypothetical protein R3247_11485 [Rhodothermales bacterium]|nr:hypothetical protein [Rhodothermales bacterium]